MLHRVQRMWRRFKRCPPGQRFQRLYGVYAEHDFAWMKSLLMFIALGCFTMGVAFVINGGPAFLMFFLVIAIVATQSPWLARQLDLAEVMVRKLTEAIRARRALARSVAR